MHQEGQERAWIPLKSRIRHKPIDSNYVRNSDGNVKSISKFMERHLLQARQPDSGKNDKIVTDGRNGTNEYRHPDPHFANFFASQTCVFLFFFFKNECCARVKSKLHVVLTSVESKFISLYIRKWIKLLGC